MPHLPPEPQRVPASAFRKPLDAWKCKNPNCGRTFSVLARISIEKRSPPSFSPDMPSRIIVEKPCCPFCESIEFERNKEAS